MSQVSQAISCRAPAGLPSSITQAIREPCTVSLLRYHVEVLSFQQLNLCGVHKHFLRQTGLRIRDEFSCVCTGKDKPLLLGKLSTTYSRLLACQPRVVADHPNVFFCPQQTTQKLVEFLVFVSTQDQASLISAQSHQAARSTSMSPTRCSLTPRTRFKQHGRQNHEPAHEKKNVFVHLRLEPQ